MLDAQGKEVIVTPVDTSIHTNPLKGKDRFTSRLTHIQEHSGYTPVMTELVWSGFNKTFDVEPYSRRIKDIGPEWRFLSTGDLDWSQVGRVIIQNLVGKNLQANPTPEEQAEIDKKIIRIRKAGCDNGLEIVVLPGGFESIHAPGETLEIRCEVEGGYGYAWIYPR